MLPRLVGRLALPIRSVAVYAAIAGPLGAQSLQYTHTGFIHGFASSDVIWRTPFPAFNGTTVVDFASTRVRLKEVWRPNLHAQSLNAVQQVQIIRDNLASQDGRHVMVGHSLGGLESRYAHIVDATARNRIAAIITVASPHQGAILADSAAKMDGFANDLLRRTRDAEPYLAVAAVGVSAWFGGVLGILTMASNAPTPLEGSAGANLLKVPTLPDLKTTSAFIATLQSNNTDAAIPRANIVARLDNNKFMPLKSLAAATGEPEQKVIDNFQKARSWFHACKIFYYATILGSPAGRKCGWAEKVMGRLDATWQSYSSGTTATQKCILHICYTVQAPRDIPSDGVVPNERSVYPFGGSGPFTNLAPVIGANHFTVYKVLEGGRRIADAMLAVGMDPQPGSTPPPPPPTLTAVISGPSSVGLYGTCTWYATASGGNPPYTYQWFTGAHPHASQGSTFNYTNSGSSFTLRVRVSDAAGNAVDEYMMVSVASSSACY